MGQIGQCIFRLKLTHTLRSDTLEKFACGQFSSPRLCRLRIITKNYGADLEIGFLAKSISKSNGCATAMPTAWKLRKIWAAPSDVSWKNQNQSRLNLRSRDDYYENREIFQHVVKISKTKATIFCVIYWRLNDVLCG